ncbi:MAG: hypothetical protein VYA54_01335 [Bdellovibrionota bacterium]|nr:hypothetical protein [Bdellovibrionota bacterium]
MKFTEAWADIVKHNQHLKISLLASVFTSVILAICTIHFSMKKPLIFERSCFTKVSKSQSLKNTAVEYENFLKKSLKQRFNTTEDIIEGFLSIKEKKNKIKEQKALSKNGLVQFVLIRKISVKDDYFIIEADRLYSIKEIRSTLPIKLKAIVQSKKRTATNPYGLILTKTEEIKEDKKQKRGQNDNK